jgi:hypothetical protein
MRASAAVLAVVLASRVVTAQNALPDRDGALVATTRAFAFYSDPVFNLHDFLVWNARSKEPVEPAVECFAGLPAEQRAAFDRAREHYKEFATPAGNRLQLALRYRLAGYGGSGLADAGAIDAALAVLPPAAAAYEKCWWRSHDARNRRWIAALEPLLAAHEDALSKRLGELYGKKLRQPLPVDVVSYVSFSGADTVVDPDHLLISSVEPANTGYAALEIVFHEASHTLFGPATDGRLWTELEAAAKADGAPLPPNFWHALLFYTTGSAVKARLAERGIDYEQLLYTQGLFDRSWPAFRAPLERVWQPYVDGRVGMAEATRQIVAAPKLPDRGDALIAASRSFVFYSDAITNLHDFLLWNARSQQPVEPAPRCVAALPKEQRAAFEHARDYYAKTFANGGAELVLLSLQWRLAKFGEINLADAAQIAATVAELTAALPAYQACWWPSHDARNRRWIAELMPLLAANEDALRMRLENLYGRDLARWLPVDVVGYAGADGGDTVLNPHHLLISSARRSNLGNAALEVVFREASHSLFSARAPGALWQALQQASTSAGKPITEDFRRLMLFFTTGEAVRARLAEQGVPDYRPYVYGEEFFARSPPAYREALEGVWRSYLDGRMPMDQAVERLVAALPMTGP